MNERIFRLAGHIVHWFDGKTLHPTVIELHQCGMNERQNSRHHQHRVGSVDLPHVPIG